MFAQLLREARAEAGLTTAELAERSATSRAAIADYEAGRKNPRTDTAERILNALGATLVGARVPRVAAKRAVFDRRDGEALRDRQLGRPLARAQTQQLLPDIIESSCAVEGIELSWGEVKALSEGITIGGDPLEIWRATEISRSARAAYKRSASERKTPLRTVVNDTLIEADEHEPAALRQIQYLVNVVAAGADPTLTLHEVSGSLVADGFPWLFVRYNDIEQYRRALVKVKRTGDGTDLVRILVDGVEGRGI